LGCDVINPGRKDTLVGEELPDHIVAVYRLYWAEGTVEITIPAIDLTKL
jgi:hypothetical protein